MTEIEDMVADYQKTRSETVFNEIYERIRHKIDRILANYKNHPEIPSALNFTVLKCVTNFDPKRNNSFCGYLSTYLSFAIKKELGRHKTLNERETPYGEQYFPDKANDEIGSLDFLKDKNLDEKDLAIIERLANGMRSADISREFRCSSALISLRIKKIRDTYPDLKSILK